MERTSVMSLIRVASWIVFIGLCIKAGALLLSGIISLIFSPQAAEHLYAEVNLAEVLTYSRIHYIGLLLLLFLIWSLKAYLFYTIINIFRKIDLSRPFSLPVASWILCLSKTALQIGILAFFTELHGKWLVDRGLEFSYNASGTEFFYLAGILFIIAKIFKRGIQMQSENELTI